jgi:hypothetical protein
VLVGGELCATSKCWSVRKGKKGEEVIVENRGNGEGDGENDDSDGKEWSIWRCLANGFVLDWLWQ